MKPEHIDLYVQRKGFAAALIEIGWAELNEEGNMVAVDYEQYNGQNTKERCANSRRVAKCRNKKLLQKQQECNGDGGTDVMQPHYKCNGEVNADVTKSKRKSITKLTDSHYSGITGAFTAPLTKQEQEQEQISSSATASEDECVKSSSARERDGDFGEWLAALKAAHPACKKARKLTRDATKAAEEAFERLPEAKDDADLLSEYFAVDDNDGYFRPLDPATYFRRLEGTIENARRWNRQRIQEAPPGLMEWLAPLMNAHPACRQASQLSRPVYEAALSAFKRLPEASEKAPLLNAYFASTLTVDRHRMPFFRPIKQDMYFERMEEVITHADRWRRETSWKQPGKKSKQSSNEEPPCHTLTPEQLSVYFAELRKNLEPHTYGKE